MSRPTRRARATGRLREADTFRGEFDTVLPHEILTWTRPAEVRLGLAAPTVPTLPEPEFLPTT